MEEASTGLMGGEASVRTRLETQTKNDDLLTKTMVRPEKRQRPKADHPKFKTDNQKKG